VAGLLLSRVPVHTLRDTLRILVLLLPLAVAAITMGGMPQAGGTGEQGS